MTSQANNRPVDANSDFRKLISTPALALPTVFLFFACLAGLASISWNTIQGTLPLWLGSLINGVIVYYFFSVVHDSSHGAISTNRWLNDFFGAIGMLFFGPIATLRLARWIHVQHHRFTNDPLKDPDHFGHKIDLWMPLRWFNFDYFYTTYFLKHAGPAMLKKLAPRLIVQIAFVVVVVAYAFHIGHGWQVVMLWLVPSRISSFLFVMVFVYLPHAPFKATAQQDEYMASNIRAGFEWLLTPLMTFHNYHLVHHLYPQAPFFRMLRIWNARREYHLAQHPYYVGTFSFGKEVSAPTQ
jgi:beta-carotene hydroxylase